MDKISVDLQSKCLQFCKIDDYLYICRLKMNKFN